MPKTQTKRCKSKKKNGAPCPNAARPGKTRCWVHDAELAERCAEGRRQGGLNRSRPAAKTLPSDVPDLPLATVGDIAIAVGAMINEVRRGLLGPQIGNCIFVGVGVLLKAIQESDLERRLADLERLQPQPHPRRIA